MKYLLNWNDEYLDMQIVSGPLADDAAAREVRKETLADDTKDAEEMYLTAEKAAESEETIGELRVNACGASIVYNGGYEDRYQIVEH